MANYAISALKIGYDHHFLYSCLNFVQKLTIIFYCVDYVLILLLTSVLHCIENTVQT